MKTANISKAERAGFLIIGIGLVASGINHLLKSPCACLVKCLSGYFLIEIGKTGHSALNDALEINTAGQSPQEAFDTYKTWLNS